MKKTLGALVCGWVLWVSAVSFAEVFPEPKVEFSADSTMEADSVSVHSKLFASPGKQRQEMGDEGGMVMIIRHDKKVIWQLMGGNMYMESSMAQAAERDPMQMDIERTLVGPETVNGVKATKYKVIAQAKDGKKFGGFLWLTPENITVKMDLLYKEGDKKQRVAIDLKNIKIAKQNAQLFEVPAGYEKVDMAGLAGSMGGGAAVRKGKGGARPKGKTGGAMDPEKMAREMMGF